MSMEQFFKAAVLCMLAIVIVLMLRNGEKGIGQLLSLLVCCIVMSYAVSALAPIVTLLRTAQRLSTLEREEFTALLKAVGISVTAEIAALLCDDSGNSAMGKALQLLATAVILALSVPMITALLELIEELGEHI